MMKSYKNIDEYIGNFPKDVQIILEELRETINKAIPNAEEAIRYGIPTFRLNNKNMVHFGGYESHIGFYPGSLAIKSFKRELAGYNLGKGTVQFLLNKPLPLSLISKMVKFSVVNRLK